MRLHLALLLIVLTAISWPEPASAGKDELLKVTALDKVNTAADEDDPFPSPDGLGLFYATNAKGTWDIYFSRRATATSAFGAGQPLIESKSADERSPFLHKATGYFYFATNKTEEKTAEKNFDIYRRVGETSPIPVQGICDKTDEINPWITPGGKELYFSRKTEEGWQLMVADGPTPGPIGKAHSVGFPPNFHHATLSSTATLMFLEGPIEGDRVGIYRSKRAKVGAEWSKPEIVPGLNHPEAKRDGSPSLNAEGTKLYFSSERPGGKGGLDLYVVPTASLK